MNKDKCQQILAAASQAFLEKGYLDTSMDSISVKAGVAKQTLYNHFANKDALFVAVVQQQCSQGEDYNLMAKVHLTIEEALHGYAKSKLADLVSSKQTAMYRMMIAEAMRFPRLGEMFFTQGMDKDRQNLVEFFSHQAAAGKLNLEDAEQAALFFQGALNAYFRPKLIMTGRLPSQAKLQTYIDYCINNFLKLYQA